MRGQLTRRKACERVLLPPGALDTPARTLPPTGDRPRDLFDPRPVQPMLRHADEHAANQARRH